jgi:hypothetical protein
VLIAVPNQQQEWAASQDRMSPRSLETTAWMEEVERRREQLPEQLPRGQGDRWC